MNQPRADWYPDPDNAAQLRYWDGAQWTDHVAPLGGSTATSAPVPTTPDGVPLAGWWWRVLATVVDGFVLGIATVPFLIPAYFLAFRQFINDVEGLENLDSTTATPDEIAQAEAEFARTMLEAFADNALWFLPMAIIPLAYVAAMLRWKGATVGKLVVGLEVRLRDAPGQLEWATIFGRTAVQHLNSVVLAIFIVLISVSTEFWPVYFVAYAVSLLYYLDALWAAWDSKRQTIHDKVARTNVVKIR